VDEHVVDEPERCEHGRLPDEPCRPCEERYWGDRVPEEVELLSARVDQRVTQVFVCSTVAGSAIFGAWATGRDDAVASGRSVIP